MDGLGLYILFNSISFISGQWKCEYERLCAKKGHLELQTILPPAGFDPESPWSEIGSANHLATQILIIIDKQINEQTDKKSMGICCLNLLSFPISHSLILATGFCTVSVTEGFLSVISSVVFSATVSDFSSIFGPISSSDLGSDSEIGKDSILTYTSQIIRLGNNPSWSLFKEMHLLLQVLKLQRQIPTVLHWRNTALNVSVT